MPLYEAPASRMPTDRTPTPEEFVAEAVRRQHWDPKEHLIAEAAVQLVCAVRHWDPDDAEHAELLQHLRMGALLGQLVDEWFGVFVPTEPVEPPAWAREIGLSPAEVRARIEKALTFPPGQRP